MHFQTKQKEIKKVSLKIHFCLHLAQFEAAVGKETDFTTLKKKSQDMQKWILIVEPVEQMRCRLTW